VVICKDLRLLPFSPIFAAKFLMLIGRKVCSALYVIEPGSDKRTTKRLDRLTLYYNIFFKLEGSVLVYLVAQEEEKEKEALK
jgi:hypothetical protein